MFFNVLSLAENTVISPFGDLDITLNKTFLSFCVAFAILRDSTLFRFMHRYVRGLK